jgi:CBS domain-containing protein
MEGDLATVLPDCPIAGAVALMIEHRISSVPVVDEAGHIVGALNERDLMKVFYLPETERVADVMTRKPIVVSEDAALVDVIDHLMSSDFRRVLIQRQERLVGVITRSHVMPALLAALEERAHGRDAHRPLH